MENALMMIKRKFFILLLMLQNICLAGTEVAKLHKGNHLFILTKDLKVKKYDLLKKKTLSSNKSNFKGQKIHHGSLALDDQYLYITYGTNFIQVLDKDTLKTVRYITFDSNVIYAPIIIKDRMFVIDIYETVYMIDLLKYDKEIIYINVEPGKILFNSRNYSLMKINDHSILITLSQGALISYDFMKKNILWENNDYYDQYSLNSLGFLYSKQYFRFVDCDKDNIVLEDNNHNLILLDTASGKLIDKVLLNNSVRNIVLHHDILFIVYNDFNFGIYYKKDRFLSLVQVLNNLVKDDLLGRRSNMLISRGIFSSYSNYSIPSTSFLFNNDYVCINLKNCQYQYQFDIKQNKFKIVKIKKIYN